jgi:two-component system, NtrC family, nitrogen regulation sensor histidine kinase NtrY
MKKLNAMGYRRFTAGLIILQLLLAVTLFTMMWTIFRSQMVITSINLAALAILELIYLVYYINRTNRDLARFFDAFRFQDGTVSFAVPDKKKKFPALYRSFEHLLDEFRLLRSSLETEKHFYLGALNHIGMGLIVASSGGAVKFSNRAIERMVESGHIDNLDALDKLKPGLGSTIMQMSPNSKELVKVVLHNEVVQLSVRCSIFRMENDLYRIISFQDIKYEIEKNEAEAWQKLIRILTHEIMNSVSPITLTSSGIIQMLEKDGHPRDLAEIDRPVLNNVLTGLQAIRKRSKGLASFVENYNAINHLPQPVMTLVTVKGLFDHIELLMKEEFLRDSVEFESMIAPPSLVLHADERLIGQILINLLRNALQAMDQVREKHIRLSAFQMDEQVRISVTDNGKGIPPELLDSVFVPFYTTRNEGSGIGLSLSREIMKLHGGGIRVYSEPGKETTFTLIF